jgi:predicted nucleic acid-binding protein
VIVVDASAVLEFLLSTPLGVRLARRIAVPEETLHAPHLLDLEVAQALRRWVRTRQISTERAAAALQDLVDLHVERYSHEILLPRIWELRDSASAYDAAYLALADLLEAPLVTSDDRLRSVPGVRVRVELP